MTDLTAPPPETSTPSPLEALQQKHRKEQRDLVSRLTQKKKQATKKTRKGVNDECDRLERELRDRQAQELLELTGEGPEAAADDEAQEDSEGEGEPVDLRALIGSSSKGGRKSSGSGAPAAKKQKK